MSPAIGMATVVFTILIGCEAWWSRKRALNLYDLRETLANFAIFAGLQLAKIGIIVWQTWVLDLFSPLAPFTLPARPGAVLLVFLVVDFLYYWQHRIMHEVRFFWCFHEVHHSSPWYNFSTSLRLNWFSGLVGIFFLLPAVLVGAPPPWIALALLINLVFQFFLHTRLIGDLGPLEGWVNTPSAHRVHHGRNPEYLDKNYGGVLMIWDRLFGTYVPESRPVQFGVTTGFHGHNPVTLVCGPFVRYARSIWACLRERVR